MRRLIDSKDGARFLRRVAEALDELAAAMEGKSGEDGRTVPAGRRPVEPPPVLKGLRQFGWRQQQAIDVLKAAFPAALTTSEIAERMGGYDTPNCWSTLRRLEDLGIVELVPGESLQRWRLGEAAKAG